MPTPRTHATLVLLAISIALLPARLAAGDEAPPVDLAWTAPAGCPSRDHVVAEIARELGPATGPRPHVLARAEPTQDEAGSWHAELVIEAGGARSVRPLAADTCDAVASAAALIIAVAVETGAPAPERVQPVSAPTLRPEPSTRPTAGARARDSKLVVALAGVVDTGTLPGVAPGLEAAVAWSYGSRNWRGRLIASGDYFARNTTTVPDHATESGQFTLLTASGRACGSRTWATFEVGPCVGGEADTMSGQGVATQQKFSPVGQWAAAIGSVLTSWHPLPVLAFSLRLDAVMPLARPNFVLAEEAPARTTTDVTVHRPAAVSARAALGVELRFF